MSRWLTLGKGSKRRVQQVRWTQNEIVSAALLLLFVAALCILATVWVESHFID